MTRATAQWWKYVMLGLVSIFLVLFPLADEPTYMHLLAMMAFYSIGAACFRLLFLVGRFSLGQSFFLMVGAYTTGILSTEVGISPWLGLLAGGLAGAILAMLLGVIILRVPGMYFAILTLALVIIGVHTIYEFPHVTGGAFGLTGIPAYSIGSFNFGVDRVPYYYMILGVGAISFLCLYRIEQSPLGLVLKALGQNDELVEHLGINVTGYRILVFTISGLFTAVAGCFIAHYLRYVSPQELGIMTSINLQIYAVVGGLGIFWGPIVGVVSLELISHLSGITLHMRPLIYGGVFVLVFIFLPTGLASLPERVISYSNRRLRKRFEAHEWGIHKTTRDHSGGDSEETETRVDC